MIKQALIEVRVNVNWRPKNWVYLKEQYIEK